MTPVPLNHEGEGVVCALCCSPAEGPCFSLAGVQSALYGLALSLLICVAAVAVFTTHVLLLLPVLLSILGKWAGGQERPACRGTFGGRRKAVRDRFALQGGTGHFP